MKPRVFVASSGRDLKVAGAVAANLAEYAEVTIWKRKFFRAGVGTIDNLTKNLNKFDFGIFILLPNDLLMIGKRTLRTARDNVIFELGMFIGKLGVERSFYIVPKRQQDFHIPSDLLGITSVSFDSEDDDIQGALDPGCRSIIEAMESVGLLYSYHITNKKSGKCLDVAGWGVDDGDRIIQYPYHGGANQLWSLRQLPDKYYCILCKNSYKCLDVCELGRADSVPIQQWDYAGGSNQQWKLIKQDDGSYWIKSRHSDKYLAVEGGSVEDGAAVVQSRLSSGDHLKWWLEFSDRMD